MSNMILTRCFFCYYDQRGQIQSLVVCYVDGFLGIHHEDHQIQELHDQLKWGELRYFEPEVPQTFNRTELCLKRNDQGRYTLRITMKKFPETVEPYVLPKGRVKKPPTLSPEEQCEFRSIAGCLQWLGLDLKQDQISVLQSL